MTKMTKTLAAKIREAGRKACREYSRSIPEMVPVCLIIQCYRCPLCVGGKDCQGNPIGTRDARIAAARAAVIELPKIKEHKGEPEAEVGARKVRRK